MLCSGEVDTVLYRSAIIFVSDGDPRDISCDEVDIIGTDLSDPIRRFPLFSAKMAEASIYPRPIRPLKPVRASIFLGLEGSQQTPLALRIGEALLPEVGDDERLPLRRRTSHGSPPHVAIFLPRDEF